jgi:hypothetical protein
MDRRKYYDKQLVEDPDLNAAVTNTYNAIGNLMADVGIFGIITGGDITEQGTPSMSVDMSTPFIGYDQVGARIYKSTGDVIDCSQDYLGNPTVPTTPGEKVWISIHGRFAYTEEDPKVIDGDTKYLTWAESYEWRVVAGTPAGGGGHTKPAPPGDAILIADIELDYGHTTILTADIDESRKDTWQFTTADNITADASGFTRLSTAPTDVQAVLADIDLHVVHRTANKIDEDLIPDGSVDLGMATKRWAEVHVDALTAYTSILASADQKVLGDATNRFNAFLYDLLVYNSLAPSADGKVLGTATKRFIPHLKQVILYDATLANALKFNAAKSVTVMVPILDSFVPTGTDWAIDAGETHLACAVGTRIVHLYFNLPHGVVLQSARIRWSQASGTGMQCQVQQVDEDNAGTIIGSGKTITTIDGSTNWEEIDSSYAHTVNRGTRHYRVLVQTTDSVAHKVYMLEVTYDITDILKAACYNCS